ncbi:MAG TPA: site-2 protease family protein [Gammaproteobacteria bacterium]|jgi:Zn-dependent protease
MEELNLMQRIAVWAIPVLFAITVHETAHGWMALRLGDPTAKMLGRLTLNPIRHIDPIGTIVVPAAMLFLGGFLFGWAKPVPITWENLRQPKRDMAWVAAAGPLSNLAMALLWAMFARLGMAIGEASGDLAMYMMYTGVAGIFINTILMLLNLLPLPPLDGSRVVSALLPGPLSYRYGLLEPYGLPILILLLITGLLGKVLWPLVMLVVMGYASVAGLSEDAFLFLLFTLLQ